MRLFRRLKLSKSVIFRRSVQPGQLQISDFRTLAREQKSKRHLNRVQSSCLLLLFLVKLAVGHITSWVTNKAPVSLGIVSGDFVCPEMFILLRVIFLRELELCVRRARERLRSGHKFVRPQSHPAGAPNDRFLSNAVRCCFRLSGVLLKLCRLISGCTKKILSVRIF